MISQVTKSSFLFTLLIKCNYLFAQITFEKSYSNNANQSSVCSDLTSDGGYISVGNFQISGNYPDI